MRHFLALSDAGSEALVAILDEAAARMAARAGLPKGAPDADMPLAGHVLAMVFEKSSTRTRVSFDMAMRQLGGSALVLDSSVTHLGAKESVADTARVLGRMADAIMLRTGAHENAEIFAARAGVPVINGLTDRSHPCQIVADLMTVIERGKPLTGLQVAWLGDGNNVLNSWIEAAGLLGFTIRAACPEGHNPDPGFVEQANKASGDVAVLRDPAEAAEGADVVVTDTWVSMGQNDADRRRAALADYRVHEALMARAKPDALFLHCLPAHVGEEVTEGVFEGPASAVFDEAENRLHAQKALLLWLFERL